MKTLIRSFAGGEITPELFGRVDLPKFQTGLATCLNFLVLPHGPVSVRPGFGYINATKVAGEASRLIPFSYSTEQAFAIEIGAGYFHWHTQGATLAHPVAVAWLTATAYVIGDLRSDGGTTYYCTTAHTSGVFATDLAAGKWHAQPATGEYEIPNPYAEADLFDIHYVQSADVLTLVHPSHAPRELRRYGATDWRLSVISFAPSLDAPAGVTVTASPASGSTVNYYKVTAVAEETLEESAASSAASATNDLTSGTNTNTVNWSAVTGAVRYNIYKRKNGLYGYIGQTDGTSFADDNIAADVAQTPPEPNDPFTGAGDYPGAATYFEQRRCFAGTVNAPQSFWMTRSATESNLSYSIPTQDDDAITVRMAAREVNAIRHLVPLGDLLILTSGGEWRVWAQSGDVISPKTISVRPQAYVGAGNQQPCVTANSVLYASAQGGRVRELSYNWESNAYRTTDVSIMAPHLFDGYEIADMAYTRAPVPVLWAVRSDGALLSMTHLPEHEVTSWAQHTTDGAFESVCAIPEDGRDALYAIVRRTIDGNTVRTVERMASRIFSAVEDWFGVDCGLTYDGAATTTISGLDHLEGETVAILADGAVVAPRAVASGAIELDEEASVVHVGLPYTADVKTLPIAVEMQAFAQGTTKAVNRVSMRVNQSSGIFAGPSFDRLTEFKQRTTEPYGSPPTLRSGEISLVVSPSWGNDGAVCVRQEAPLPLTVLAMVLDFVTGN